MACNPEKVNIEWHIYQQSIVIYFEYRELIIHKGDFITYDERNESGVIVEDFTGHDMDGPVGLIYRPWRGNRWASIAFSISHGNLRHIICYPIGYMNYGLHINWSSVRVINELKPKIPL